MSHRRSPRSDLTATRRHASGWLTALMALIVGLAALASPPLMAQTPMQSRLNDAGQSRPAADAQAELRNGNPARALAIAESALKSFPTDARLQFSRALALQRLGRLPDAEAAFLTMTLEFPELPEPYNNLAVVRAAQGRLEQARVALEDAIRAVPGYAPAHENLADIYLQLAVRNLAEASRLEPGNAALAARARMLAEQAARDPAARPSSPSTTPR